MPQGCWSIQLTDNIFFSHPCFSADISTDRRAVLLINLTGSAELVNVRQTLCRVSDSSNIPNGILLDVKNFLCAVYAFPSIGDINKKHAYWLPLTFQPLSLKWVDLIGPQSEPS
jgi:hypothetical protein